MATNVDIMHDEAEQIVLPVMKALLDSMSMKWEEFYWTLQVRGGVSLARWTLSGFKHGCDLEDDEVAASVSLHYAESPPTMAVEVWLGAACVWESEAVPSSVPELREFLMRAIEPMAIELGGAARRLSDALRDARGPDTR